MAVMVTVVLEHEEISHISPSYYIMYYIERQQLPYTRRNTSQLADCSHGNSI